MKTKDNKNEPRILKSEQQHLRPTDRKNSFSYASAFDRGNDFSVLEFHISKLVVFHSAVL